MTDWRRDYRRRATKANPVETEAEIVTAFPRQAVVFGGSTSDAEFALSGRTGVVACALNEKMSTLDETMRREPIQQRFVAISWVDEGARLPVHAYKPTRDDVFHDRAR
jgi:hypothetical protein